MKTLPPSPSFMVCPVHFLFTALQFTLFNSINSVLRLLRFNGFAFRSFSALSSSAFAVSDASCCIALTVWEEEVVDIKRRKIAKSIRADSASDTKKVMSLRYDVRKLLFGLSVTCVMSDIYVILAQDSGR